MRGDPLDHRGCGCDRLHQAAPGAWGEMNMGVQVLQGGIWGGGCIESLRYGSSLEIMDGARSRHSARGACVFAFRGALVYNVHCVQSAIDGMSERILFFSVAQTDPKSCQRESHGCPALLLFLYSTLVVGLLIRWRLQTTVGPSEEGVTITRLSSSDGRTYIRTDMGGLRATHRSPYLLTPLIDRPGVPGCRGHACPTARRAATLAPARPTLSAASAARASVSMTARPSPPFLQPPPRPLSPPSGEWAWALAGDAPFAWSTAGDA